jgi:hypothetical protein
MPYKRTPKKRTRKRRTLKGGVLLGKGMFGNVYRPPLDCVDPANTPTNNGTIVSKMQTKENANVEYNRTRELEGESIFLVPFKKCEWNGKPKNNPIKRGNTLLFMKYGGKSMLDLPWDDIIQEKSRLFDLLIAYSSLIKGLYSWASKTKKIVSDLNPNNILYNEDTKTFTIIDTGELYDMKNLGGDQYYNVKSLFPMLLHILNGHTRHSTIPIKPIIDKYLALYLNKQSSEKPSGEDTISKLDTFIEEIRDS